MQEPIAPEGCSSGNSLAISPFSAAYNTPALYQGTTLVVPIDDPNRAWALAPAVRSSWDSPAVPLSAACFASERMVC